MSKLFTVLFFSLLLKCQAWGSACCGGGVAAPSLILGDDKAILTNSFSYGTITDDVSANGVWRKRDEQSVIQSYRLEGAHIYHDRFQFGGSLPLVSRSRRSQDSAGLGDVALTAGYEFLPEWSYSSWKPKGLGFLQLTLPTGRSIYESDEEEQLDARGRGFWALGAGAVFTKIIGKWDLFTSGEWHKSFSKKVNSPQAQGRLNLEPGFGGTAQVGVGYNVSHYRVGTSLQWYHEDEIKISGALEDKKALERYTTAMLTGSYLYSDEWSASLSYADQTVMGSPRNTSLGQVIGVQLQRRWSR